MEPFTITLATYNSLPASLRKTDAQTRTRYVFVNGAWRQVKWQVKG